MAFPHCQAALITSSFFWPMERGRVSVFLFVLPYLIMDLLNLIAFIINVDQLISIYRQNQELLIIFNSTVKQS